MCQEEEDLIILKLLEDKYMKGNYLDQDLEKLSAFFDYFRVQ